MNLGINNNLGFKGQMGVKVASGSISNLKTKTVWIDTDYIRNISRSYGGSHQPSITVQTDSGHKIVPVVNKYSDILDAYTAASQRKSIDVEA